MENFFLVTGNDEFAIKARSREHIVRFCGEDFDSDSSLEAVRGDGDDSPPAAILSKFISALKTPPFLTAMKVVWLRHFNYFDEVCDSSANDATTEAVAQLITFLKSPLPEDVIVIIDGPGLDQRKALFKAFKQVNGAVIDVYKKADLSDRDYSKSQGERVTQLVRQQKKQIEPAAMEYLINAAGSDSGRMLNELSKLAIYLGEERKMITLDDCRNICSRTPEALSWEFANALTSGDTAAALTVADISIESMKSAKNGNIELGLIFQAMRAFKDIMDTQLAMQELNIPSHAGSNYFYNMPEEQKTKFPNNILVKSHPFRAFKLTETAAGFPAKKVAVAFRALLEANRRLVTSGADSRLVLEEMIIKICS